MFHHPAWAVGSCNSGPLAARIVRTKSTGGCNCPEWSPCTCSSKNFPSIFRHRTPSGCRSRRTPRRPPASGAAPAAPGPPSHPSSRSPEYRYGIIKLEPYACLSPDSVGKVSKYFFFPQAVSEQRQQQIAAAAQGNHLQNVIQIPQIQAHQV